MAKLDTLNDADRRAFTSFVDDGGRPLSAATARRMLCILQHVVSHSGVTSYPDAPADCICEPKNDWQNDGEALRFIILSTLDAIDARKNLVSR